MTFATYVRIALAVSGLFILHALWPHDGLHAALAQATSECIGFPVSGFNVCLSPLATPIAVTNTPVASPTVAASPTATATAVPPTATRTPTAVPPTSTATLAPTLVPTTVPTSTPIVMGTWNGVPICTGHDNTVWHPLVQRNANGSVACTYTHDHGDDPRTLDALFGSAGSQWGAPGHAIGYPWVSSPVENVEKHQLFKFIVRENLPPRPNNEPYVRNFRAWGHRLGSGGMIPGVTSKDGFQTLVHSWAIEVEVCRPGGNSCGILHAGGLQDLGIGLLNDGANDQNDICAMSQPALNLLSCVEQKLSGLTPQHLHGTLTGSRHDATWYSRTSPSYQRTSSGQAWGMDLGTLFEAWAPVDPANVNALPFHDPDVYDGSYDSMEILGLNFDNSGLDIPLPGTHTVNGVQQIDYNGYTDRWGVFQTGCTAPSSTCVPWIAEHLPVVNIQYRDSNTATQLGHTVIRERGVQVGGKSMSKYPG